MAEDRKRRQAALIVEQGLGAVFGAAMVAGLREDSPLSALGMTAADGVCVADAVAEAAQEVGWACRLGDDAMQRAATVSALIDEVLAEAAPAEADEDPGLRDARRRGEGRT